MTGELWFLSVTFGLAVSATLYLVFIWPAREPDEVPEGEVPKGDVSAPDGAPEPGNDAAA